MDTVQTPGHSIRDEEVALGDIPEAGTDDTMRTKKGREVLFMNLQTAKGRERLGNLLGRSTAELPQGRALLLNLEAVSDNWFVEQGRPEETPKVWIGPEVEREIMEVTLQNMGNLHRHLEEKSRSGTFIQLNISADVLTDLSAEQAAELSDTVADHTKVITNCIELFYRLAEQEIYMENC